jgi:hypothetical protein
MVYGTNCYHICNWSSSIWIDFYWNVNYLIFLLRKFQWFILGILFLHHFGLIR